MLVLMLVVLMLLRLLMLLVLRLMMLLRKLLLAFAVAFGRNLMFARAFGGQHFGSEATLSLGGRDLFASQPLDVRLLLGLGRRR